MSAHKPRGSSAGNSSKAQRGLVYQRPKASVSPILEQADGVKHINWHAIDAAADACLQRMGLSKREYSGSWGWCGGGRL